MKVTPQIINVVVVCVIRLPQQIAFAQDGQRSFYRPNRAMLDKAAAELEVEADELIAQKKR